MRRIMVTVKDDQALDVDAIDVCMRSIMDTANGDQVTPISRQRYGHCDWRIGDAPDKQGM